MVSKKIIVALVIVMLFLIGAAIALGLIPLYIKEAGPTTKIIITVTKNPTGSVTTMTTTTTILTQAPVAYYKVSVKTCFIGTSNDASVIDACYASASQRNYTQKATISLMDTNFKNKMSNEVYKTNSNIKVNEVLSSCIVVRNRRNIRATEANVNFDAVFQMSPFNYSQTVATTLTNVIKSLNTSYLTTNEINNVKLDSPTVTSIDSVTNTTTSSAISHFKMKMSFMNDSRSLFITVFTLAFFRFVL